MLLLLLTTVTLLGVQGETTVTMVAPTFSTVSLLPVMGVEYGCNMSHFNHALNNHGKLLTIGETCYELVHQLRTWPGAEHDCVHRGGHLVHIDTPELQDRLYQVVKQYHHHNIWIGFNDRTNETLFKWSSGDPVIYTNWYNTTRTFDNEHQDCVVIGLGHFNGQWEDMSCQHTNGYICEFDAVQYAATTTTTERPNYNRTLDGNAQLCPERLQGFAATHNLTIGQYGHSCYELLHRQISYNDSEQMCRRTGGHLVHINNAHEQTFVTSFLHRHTSSHVGKVWIGLNDFTKEGHYTWTDGGRLNYTHWGPDKVDHQGQDCVVLIPYMGGIWDDISCASTVHHYPLCEFPTTVSAIGSVIVG